MKPMKIIFRFCSTETIGPGQKVSKFELKNFADQVKLKVIAGSGGNGCYTFYTDKIVRRGAPDGGNGGTGGEILIQAHKAVHDLSHFRRKVIRGHDGNNGGPQGQNGKNGGKTMLRVPCGTVVHQIDTLDEIQHKKLKADLDLHRKTYLAVKGGKGGFGNKLHPNMTEEQKIGQPGKQVLISLQLKILADVGLVGFPNIGKSTFLAAISRALPKIANYQFTTLKPSIGYVKFVDEFKMTVADLPGIIEGASNNKGLGFQFLRHIQRTKILVLMIDITNDPYDQYKKLSAELKEYKGDFFKNRDKIIVVNKSDCLSAQRAAQVFGALRKKVNGECFLISAKEGNCVGNVLLNLREKVQLLLKKEEQLSASKIVRNQIF